MAAALAGVKVLDLTRYIAGPFCTQILGDLGADIVKVERVDGGDEGRHVGELVAGDSLFFLSANRNKRSVALNLRAPEAQDVLRRLAAGCDILIENFRPGTMEKMGCGYPELAALNPGLIMVRVSGFGQDGPLAHHPCFDGAAQALSGVMALTGPADGPPIMAGVFVADYSTALYATIAALAALQARHATGKGQMVEATLMESAMSMLTTAIPEQLLLGKESHRLGNRDRYLPPSHCFRSRDGAWVYVVAGNAEHFPRFATAIGEPGLASDPRFGSYAARRENVATLESIIDGWGLAHDAAEILATLHGAGIPCEQVSSIAELVEHAQVRHRGQIVDVPHRTLGTVPMQATAVRMHGTPATIRSGAPALGEHTGEVLHEWLGLGEAELAVLREAGAL